LDFLPLRSAFGREFWLGVTWGLASITALVLGMRALRVFYFGSVALHGAQLIKFASLWGIAFLLVGIFEESMSRGYAQLVLLRGIGFWPAAIVNSVLFGAIHLTNKGESAMGIASVICIALFFCLTLRRTGALWFAVGFHAMWDYGETFVYGVADSAEVATGRLFNSHSQGSHWISGGRVGPEGSVLVFVGVRARGAAFPLFISGTDDPP
jgi:membrane protease YdiL (CAAX protease family)